MKLALLVFMIVFLINPNYIENVIKEYNKIILENLDINLEQIIPDYKYPEDFERIDKSKLLKSKYSLMPT